MQRRAGEQNREQNKGYVRLWATDVQGCPAAILPVAACHADQPRVHERLCGGLHHPTRVPGRRPRCLGGAMTIKSAMPEFALWGSECGGQGGDHG